VRFAMKVSKSSNREMILDCLSIFGFELPSHVITKREREFELEFKNIVNTVCVCVMAAYLRPQIP
jgi:hypothetical protein